MTTPADNRPDRLTRPVLDPQDLSSLEIMYLVRRARVRQNAAIGDAILKAGAAVIGAPARLLHWLQDLFGATPTHAAR